MLQQLCQLSNTCIPLPADECALGYCATDGVEVRALGMSHSTPFRPTPCSPIQITRLAVAAYYDPPAGSVVGQQHISAYVQPQVQSPASASRQAPQQRPTAGTASTLLRPPGMLAAALSGGRRVADGAALATFLPCDEGVDEDEGWDSGAMWPVASSMDRGAA